MDNDKNTRKELDIERRQRRNNHIARRILALMTIIGLSMLAGATLHWALNLAIITAVFVWAMFYCDAVEEPEE